MGGQYKVWCYDGEYDAETGTCVTASNVFVCNPETGGTFTVLDAPMCLKKGLPQNKDVGLITKRDNQTYHIMLSTTDRVIHEGSSNKLVVIGSNTTWYAYDESVE